MKCGRICSTFLYLMTIIVIVNINISTIICYDVTVDKNPNNDFSSEEEHHYLQHHPITFTYGNSEKYPWRQKSYNTESERLPLSTIVGLQQSNQGYNSWKNENHYKHDNENHKENEITKFSDNQESNDIYGFDIEPNYIDEIRNKKRSRESNGITFVEPKDHDQHVCEIEKKTVKLNTESHIYFPDEYIEEKCKYEMSVSESKRQGKNKSCNIIGFQCSTKKSTLYITRRENKPNFTCWETDTRYVPTGCECKGPGDVKILKL